MIADDPTTPGGIEAKQVLETFVRETDTLVDLYVDGEVISTTGEHPFWVADQGWVEAYDLVVGSLLQTGDGRVVDVDRVLKREGKFPVYNFKVEGIPTYFVSDLGVLVHNADYPSPMVNNPNYQPTRDNWEWKKPKDWADHDHDIIKGEIRNQTKGYESGRHDQFPSAMRDRLEQLAKESERRGDLPEYAERLREIAITYDKRAKGSHRGGGRGS